MGSEVTETRSGHCGDQRRRVLEQVSELGLEERGKEPDWQIRRRTSRQMQEMLPTSASHMNRATLEITKIIS